MSQLYPNNVTQVRLIADPQTGKLNVIYPANYIGTSFYMLNEVLYASTPAGVTTPSFTLSDGVLYVDVDNTTALGTYQQYLAALNKPFTKLCKLEFLNPDGSVAFTVGNTIARGYMTTHSTRAFIQSGSLNVSLQNGQRRKASVTLANVDGAFDYNVNNLWFGQQIRLSMGMILPDGTDFYIPQGVFYAQDPQTEIKPNGRTITYNLVDKWAYLDGSLFGTVETTYQVNKLEDGVRNNIFDAMSKILLLSKIDYSDNGGQNAIDRTAPVFTTYYDGRTYTDESGTVLYVTDVPYDMTVTSGNGTLANLLLELNTMLAGWIGYDATGALRVEPSQEDISDAEKPVLWEFSPENSLLNAMTETARNTEVYNDVLIAGTGLSGFEIYGRAMNYDPASDTNVNLIGRKLYREDRADFWTAEQCVDLAKWQLKQKTVLQKSVTITAPQMFHLVENNLVTVKRTDKPGAPVERHIIESFSIPIAQTGAMTINCTSVDDFPNMQITSSAEITPTEA